MGDWQLGIDFGTSYTVAAVLEDGHVKVIDVESNGQSRIPSVAFLNSDGDLLVGANALHQAVFAPDCFEPSPKRCIADGEVFLGEQFVPVADLISAVLRRVYAEACRQHGGVVPSATRVTHPAEWAEARLNVLRAAIEGASLPHAVLVPEPVAAAAWIAMAKTEPGSYIAVYDFGGGTFDAAVLKRTTDGFDVAGPPSGRDPLGGEDLDRLIVDHLGELLSQDFPEEWGRLMNPPDAASRRQAAQLRAEVQRAKETLSDVLVCQLWVPGIEREVQFTRAELESLIGPAVSETLASLTEAIEAAELTPAELSGIYLVGGSSRIPAVADMIWRELAIRPAVQDNPKSVVAMGAAAWGSPLHTAAAAVTTEARPASSVGPTAIPGAGTLEAGFDGRFRSQLVMVKGAGAERRGSVFSALVVLQQPGGAAVRLRDEPANERDAGELAREVLATRSARMPGFTELSFDALDVLGLPGGFERRFRASTNAGLVEMFERYLVVGDRAVVLAGPEEARHVADGLKIADPTLPLGKYYEPSFEAVLPDGWMASERVVLTQGGTGREVTADHVVAPTAVTLDQWRDRQVSALLGSVPKAEAGAPIAARVLGRLDGQEVAVRSKQGRASVLTKLWLATLGDRHAYEVTITLRERDQALFPTLAAIALLSPTAFVRHPKIAAPAPGT